MQRILLVLAAAIVGALLVTTSFVATSPAASASVEPGDYEIDTSHSTVLFSIRHFGVGQFFGRFNGIEGTYRLDAANLDQTSVKVDVMSSSVDTNNKGRDRHLKASDFFDARQFPKISFVSTSATVSGDKRFDLTGELTMLGIKKTVTFACEFIGEGEDQWKNFRTGFVSRATIKRSDFKMNYGLNDGALGDEVELTISVEGIRKKE